MRIIYVLQIIHCGYSIDVYALRALCTRYVYLLYYITIGTIHVILYTYIYTTCYAWLFLLFLAVNNITYITYHNMIENDLFDGEQFNIMHARCIGSSVFKCNII